MPVSAVWRWITPPRPRYDLHEMAIAAVLSQQGVALVPKMYVESELRAGTLAAPWPGSPTLAKRFCLIKPGGGEGEPALQMFERWLQTEIAAG